MIFETVRSGGCMSYLIGCEAQCVGAIVDPALDLADRYEALAAAKGVHIRYLIDTHTHADHFSALREMGQRLGAHTIMHRSAASPFVDVTVDDGESIIVGTLRLRVLYTPGHTNDSVCLVLPDRVLTGDTLLLGGTGRTDLPSGSPEQLYDSLFNRLLKLDDGLRVYPAHNYKNAPTTTLGEEKASNPRLQTRELGAFVEMMNTLNLDMPQHLTEALRTNRTGGRTVTQLIHDAGTRVSFMGMDELRRRVSGQDQSVLVLDVRESEAFAAGHIPGARNIPRGQLELRVDQAFPDPAIRIVTYCELGKISTLAAATLRDMGFNRAVALDGGMRAWKEAGYPVETGAAT
jgi:glyoxylase-like metal-dependent hydrolase (beta-lactamase superfamily II)/rhodanese-related sulfurtransferase